MLLNQEQQMIRDSVRAFAAERLAPNAAQWDRDCVFPRAQLAEMAQMGLLGVTVPEQWGGAGLDYVSLAVALEEIAAGDGATSTIASVQALVCNIFNGYASDAQKERFLKPLARGEMLGCFCLTEPHVGSDAGAISTRAERIGAEYALHGVKQFITSGKNADVAVVFAVTDKAAGKKGISAFIVPTGTAGYVVTRSEDKLGQHAAENLLGPEGMGYRIALSSLEGWRICIAAQSVGMARAAFEAALKYAHERVSFGKPIIEHQAVNFRLADMATQIEVARQMVLHAATLRDAALPCLKEASMAKLFASEMAEKVCSDAIQIHGGYGYVNDFPVERIYRDVRAVQKRQADVHAVIDVGVVVVEFLVAMADAGCGQARGQHPAAVVNVVLVAPAAVDVDAAQRLEIGAVFLHQIDRVVAAPVVPAPGLGLAGFQIDRNAESERRLQVRVVTGGHADVHNAMAFGGRELLLLPHMVEEALNPPVVESLRRATVARCAAHVHGAGLALDRAVLRQRVERIRPVVPVDEIEVRVARMIGDRAPVLGVLHAVDDRAVTAGRLAEAAAV